MSIANNPSISSVHPQLFETVDTEGRHRRIDQENHPILAEAGEALQDTFNNVEEEAKGKKALQVGGAALHGAVVGPFQQIREIGGEIKQAVRDYRSVKELAKENQTNASDKFGFFAMKAWYAAPFPAYQVADDALTYPLYLHVQDQFNTGTAYGVAAGATFALATTMGYGQRAVEKKKAELIGTTTEDDNSDHIPQLLDSTVNSAPWQVVRRANEPREEGDPVKLVRRARIAQYAAAYATVNTVLYTAAEKLPVNEWVGFGAMLWGVWALGGAYREVKEQVNTPAPGKHIKGLQYE